jgi:BlaI family transcriptional regulator, penicillinase repressor
MNDPLSRRERQIMDLVYRLGRVSVSEVHQGLPDAPSYSAVRALMGTLTEKGHLVYERDGRRYVYRPAVPAEEASTSALRRVIATFFKGSPLQAALALVSEATLDGEELEALEAAIARAREEEG